MTHLQAVGGRYLKEEFVRAVMDDDADTALIMANGMTEHEKYELHTALQLAADLMYRVRQLEKETQNG